MYRLHTIIRTCYACMALFPMLLVPLCAPAAEPHPQTYVELGLVNTLLDQPLEVYPKDATDSERISYSQALGGYLRGSWQSRVGAFAYGEYLGVDGCVNNCLSSGESEGTHAGIERYAFGLGWHWQDIRNIDLYVTAARENRTVELCQDEEAAEGEGCRRGRRQWTSLGIGAQYPFTERWQLGVRYEHYLGENQTDDSLLRLSNGRTTFTASARLSRHGVYGLVAYQEARTSHLRVGLRFRF